MATAIFYASSTGNTADVATRISKQLGDIEIFDISDDGVNSMKEYDKLILGVSTWGDGELSDDWEDVIDDFSEIDFSGKTIALFGLGDQDGYPECFLDAMGILYEQVLIMGGNIVGFWDIDGYDFDQSNAVVSGQFVGLALDEDNQDELTGDRVQQWCEQIKGDIL